VTGYGAGIAIGILAVMPLACGDPEPSSACIAAEEVTVRIPFARLVVVSHEAQSDLELVRFEFDRSVAGDVKATAQAIERGDHIEASTGEVVTPQGEEFTSIRLDGLVGGAATDRIRSGRADPYGIREIVQVRDGDGFQWVVGTAADACRRLNANVDAGLLVLAVTPA
jgi:hypothetical protein